MKQFSAQFTNQQYINLETFRKNGIGVKTPVWFLQDGDTLYVRTLDGAGKVKRVRATHRVRVAPCKVDGQLLGDWEDGVAEIAGEEEARQVDRKLTRKYGATKLAFELINKLRGNRAAVIRIAPVKEI